MLNKTLSDPTPYLPSKAGGLVERIPGDKRSYRWATRQLHYRAVERVIQAMHERLDQPFPMQAMARIAFISPYHFNRLFRQITGIPPSQFLYALRLEAAKRLLLTTRLSVLEVCYEVGYNSLGTFTRRFSDLLGVSPTRLRSMACCPVDKLFKEVKKLPNYTQSGAPGTIAGEIDAPSDFCGQIFVGLFPSQIPQGKPVACTLLNRAGQYQISNVPDGTYYLFAAGISIPEDPSGYLRYESALRAGGQAIDSMNREIKGETNLRLRAPSIFDPPILMTFPALIAATGVEKVVEQHRN